MGSCEEKQMNKLVCIEEGCTERVVSPILEGVTYKDRTCDVCRGLMCEQHVVGLECLVGKAYVTSYVLCKTCFNLVTRFINREAEKILKKMGKEV